MKTERRHRITGGHSANTVSCSCSAICHSSSLNLYCHRLAALFPTISFTAVLYASSKCQHIECQIPPGWYVTRHLPCIQFQLHQCLEPHSEDYHGKLSHSECNLLKLHNSSKHCTKLQALLTFTSGDGQSRFGVWTGFGSGSAQCGWTSDPAKNRAKYWQDIMRFFTQILPRTNYSNRINFFEPFTLGKSISQSESVP